MYADLPLGELREHRTTVTAPDGLDAFWAGTLARARAAAAPPTLAPVPQPLRTVTSQDVRFAGFDGEPIAAWYHRPAATDPGTSLPCVVTYAGYNGGRGLAHESTLWAAAGYAALVVDTRGQGGGYAVGCTPDPHGSGPSHPGFLTRGVERPETYYYVRLLADAALAVDAARALPGVDGRVVVAGGSQGGGLAVAAAALADGVTAALVDVPFLCEIARGAWITDDDPYAEVRRYLAVRRDEIEATLRTLSFVDGSVLAARAEAPVLMSVGLMDPVCPPSTVYAAYHAWRGPKTIVEYPYNGHEGGGAQHVGRQLAWLADVLG